MFCIGISFPGVNMKRLTTRLCKIQGLLLLKDNPTIFKDYRFMRSTNLHVKIQLPE